VRAVNLEEVRVTQYGPVVRTKMISQPFLVSDTNNLKIMEKLKDAIMAEVTCFSDGFAMNKLAYA